jgi:hypothetical protein
MQFDQAWKQGSEHERGELERTEAGGWIGGYRKVQQVMLLGMPGLQSMGALV